MGSRISPTAHYTGHIWVRHGLAPPALDTTLGRAMYAALRPVNTVVRPFVGGTTLERYLRDRHVMLDRLLERAIEANGATQVLEVAAGLSPRGATFAARYPNIRYVEADLAPMVARKRALLAKMKFEAKNHSIATIDLLDVGSQWSLQSVVDRQLEPSRSTVLITEGLLSYFDAVTLESLWPRFRAALDRFPDGLLLANVELESEAGAWALVRAFVKGLGLYTGAPTRLLFRDDVAAQMKLLGAGFDRVELLSPRDLIEHATGPTMVRALAAWLRYTHWS